MRLEPVEKTNGTAQTAPPERWQHGDKAEEQGRQRTQSSLVALHASKRIDDADLASALRWERDYAMAEFGARLDDYTSSGEAALPGVSLMQMNAVAALRDANAAVGVMGARILGLIVADGRSINAITLVIKGTDARMDKAEMAGVWLRHQAADRALPRHRRQGETTIGAGWTHSTRTA